MNHCIALHQVSVQVPIFDAGRSFRRSLVNCLGGEITQNNKKVVYVHALREISFSLNRGDRLGLIGHNGAGKTTLLRLLAHIYRPTHGHYMCRGKVVPLLNIGVGIDLDDNGIENVRAMGMLLGMSRQEIASKQREIIEFSELGDFIHLPVRTYSAGMLTRLSFAIVTAVEADIVLMDENIGTGDASFENKAEQRLNHFYQGMNTLVLASHSNALIRKVCNKAMLLEHGRIKAFGDVDEVVAVYEADS